VLPPVHDLDHRGAGPGRDLDEVEFGIAGSLAGFIQRDDPDLLSVGSNETNGADPDLFIYARI
jgi:hypothetical protein